MRQAYDEIATLFRAMPSTAGGAKHRPTTRALPAALARSTTPAMVGRARVELATSRLSGVRSNHLSYRPAHAAPVSRGEAAPYGRASPRWPSLSARKIAHAILSRRLT